MVIVSGNVSQESRDLIDRTKARNPHFEFSNWLDHIIQRELRDVQSMQLQLAMVKKQEEMLLVDIELFSKYQPPTVELTSHQVGFLLDTIKVIDLDPDKLQPRINAYNNNYGVKLTKARFLDLLEKVKIRPRLKA